MIGHVAPGPVFDALVAARDALAATAAGPTFAWLPPPSYHMTIFDGLLYHRRGADFWPAELSTDADDAEERRLRALRDACAEAVGLARRPGHASYPFHITMAYSIAWQSRADAKAFDIALAEANADFRAAAPIIEIGPPELCRFADMTHFALVKRL
jgi:hypothetical protein